MTGIPSWYSKGIVEEFHLLTFDRSPASRRRTAAILYHILVFVSKWSEGDRLLDRATPIAYVFHVTASPPFRFTLPRERAFRKNPSELREAP